MEHPFECTLLLKVACLFKHRAKEVVCIFKCESKIKNKETTNNKHLVPVAILQCRLDICI